MLSFVTHKFMKSVRHWSTGEAFTSANMTGLRTRINFTTNIKVWSDVSNQLLPLPPQQGEPKVRPPMMSKSTWILVYWRSASALISARAHRWILPVSTFICGHAPHTCTHDTESAFISLKYLQRWRHLRLATETHPFAVVFTLSQLQKQACLYRSTCEFH